MTRIARIVVPRAPHHVTQRGNRRERVFLEPRDYELYRDWLAESCRKFGVSVWAYCLMPNHVHLVLAPSDPAGLALALSRAHRLYAGYFNARARQTGHLFQGRFGSLAMDEDHLIAAVRYVALNPVRARLVATASEWPHSSVRAHMAGVDDALVSVQPLRDRVANFADLLDTDPDDPEFNALRRNELIGRPLGSPDFLDAVSRQLNRVVTPSKRGRKPKAATPIKRE